MTIVYFDYVQRSCSSLYRLQNCALHYITFSFIFFVFGIDNHIASLPAAITVL